MTYIRPIHLLIASGDDSAPVAFVGTSRSPEAFCEAFCATTSEFNSVAKIAIANKYMLEPSMGKVGNAYTFIKSSSEESLTEFMRLINKVLHNEELISDFRKAEVKKAEVESEQG